MCDCSFFLKALYDVAEMIFPQDNGKIKTVLWSVLT
jgi:hypothetical protein